MDVTNEAAAGGSEPTVIDVAPAPAGEAPTDPREAARNVAKWRHKREQQGLQLQTPDGQDRKYDASSPPPQAADNSDSAGREISVDEIAAHERPNESVPIAAPPGWKEQDKELFASLPRPLQERLVADERSHEARLAQEQKANEADRALGQARQNYEAALPRVLAALQLQQMTEFADLKTPADLERLGRENPGRYRKWSLQETRISELAREMREAQERKVAEQQRRFADFARRQDDLFKERVPEMADSAAAAQLERAAMAVLKQRGFDETELAASWHGQKEFPLCDHRIQLLVRDAILWRQAQAKAKAAAAKPLPPVQRPGVAQFRTAARQEEIQSLSKKLDATGSLKDAAALLRARRAAW
jgi:hypothetical protein